MNATNLRIVLCLLLMVPVGASQAADPIRWNYVSSETSFEGKWHTVKGEAIVQIDGDKISASLFSPLEVPGAGTRDQPIEKIASNTLDGTITKDGNIVAVEHSVGTEPNDVKIEGHLFKRVDHQVWGDKDVNVVYETIILSNKYLIIGLTRRYREQ